MEALQVGPSCSSCAACGCAQRHAGPQRPHVGVESPELVAHSETDQLIPHRMPVLSGPLDPAGRSAPFGERLRGRVTLLVGLLIFQSVSSFILASYSELLQQHSVIVYFLTMLVGAGGNAGNQAAVLVIRGLATGDVRGWAQYLWGEVKMAVAISIIMVAAGFARVTLFHGSYQDAVAIASSLLAIVFISIVVGASLPLLLHMLRLDPAHAGATIQVIMDLAGVLITCMVCSVLLRSEVLTPDVVPQEFHHISSTKAVFATTEQAGWEQT